MSLICCPVLTWPHPGEEWTDSCTELWQLRTCKKRCIGMGWRCMERQVHRCSLLDESILHIRFQHKILQSQKTRRRFDASQPHRTAPGSPGSTRLSTPRPAVHTHSRLKASCLGEMAVPGLPALPAMADFLQPRQSGRPSFLAHHSSLTDTCLDTCSLSHACTHARLVIHESKARGALQHGTCVAQCALLLTGEQHRHLRARATPTPASAPQSAWWYSDSHPQLYITAVSDCQSRCGSSLWDPESGSQPGPPREPQRVRFFASPVVSHHPLYASSCVSASELIAESDAPNWSLIACHSLSFLPLRPCASHLCLCPPLRDAPLGPSCVRYPSGSRVMKSWALARRAARSTADVASACWCSLALSAVKDTA